MFRLKVFVPSGVVFDDEVEFLRAEDHTGTFGILSRHTDFLTILKPSVVIIKKEGSELYLAVKGGILSFQDNLARITTEAAVQGESLEELYELVSKRFMEETERERILGETIKNMEKGFLKRLIELEREYG
jgi:F-type H+-transporting ATPase subunit epsilon